MLADLSGRHPADSADPPGAAAGSVLPVRSFSPGRGTGGLREPGQASVSDQVREAHHLSEEKYIFFSATPTHFPAPLPEALIIM